MDNNLQSKLGHNLVRQGMILFLLMWLYIEIILEHILLIGLPLGILVQRNANINQ